MTSTTVPRTVFVLGILHRSGTNYLTDLLVRHRDCQRVRDLPEDYLVAHIDLLESFVDRVSSAWNARWDPHGVMRQRLRSALGRACTEFLLATAEPTLRGEPRFLVTKTPKAANLAHFSAIPDARAVVIVRDGRAVAESGARSFGWRLERTARAWARGADEILAARDGGVHFHLVRYEDLVRELEPTLLGIFEHVGMDPARYNFQAARSLPVRGSSTVAERPGDGMHWRLVEKSDDFDPLARWATWDQSRHAQFNAIAGEQMEALGYELVDT